MDQTLINKWQDAIDSSPCTKREKAMLSQYVADMLNRDGVIIINASHLAQLIGLKEEVIHKMIVVPECFYRSFTIPKRSGDERLISAPYPALMLAQRWIYENILLPGVEVSESAMGFVPRKSILDNAILHLNRKEVLKMDLKDFFPSIDIKRVISVFKGLGYYHRMAYYLASICCENKHLPQGAPTSPILSNIVTKRLDYRLKNLADKYNLVYTRYADDMTFSGDHIPVKFISIVSDIVADEKFEVHMEKTVIMREKNRKIITGVSVSSERPCIPRAKKRWIRQQTYYIKRFGLRSHMKRTHIVDPFYDIRMNGYLAYWKSIEPENPYLKKIMK